MVGTTTTANYGLFFTIYKSQEGIEQHCKLGACSLLSVEVQAQDLVCFVFLNQDTQFLLRMLNILLFSEMLNKETE
jgi:hypothetical protein